MIFDKKNDELEKYLKGLFNEEYNEFINSTAEPSTIRINTLKIRVKEFEKKLNRWGQNYKKIDFQPTGLILGEDKIPLSHTLDYFCGNFYYQGVSSQIPVELLDIKPGEVVLDMAAAPGSKSCQILNKLNHRGYLVINDSSFKRLQPLNVNVQRSGATNYYIINTWGEQLGQKYHDTFDKVLVDAPCTALGTLATSKNEIANWWSFEKLKKLTQSQYALLVAGLKALKVGGELVYSTCSFAPEENEIIIQKVLESYPAKIVSLPKKLQNIFSPGLASYNKVTFSENMQNAIRVYPHKHGFEGFFAIKLRKTDTIKNKNQNTNLKTKKLLKWNEPLISDILIELSETWGIEETKWKNYKYYLTKTRIWIVGEIDAIPINNFVCSGVLLAEKKLSGWKLFNNSVTFFNSRITKRTIELKDEELKLLFKNGEISFNGFGNGYYVLTRKQNPFASVYIENGKMRIKLPHSFNLILD